MFEQFRVRPAGRINVGVQPTIGDWVEVYRDRLPLEAEMLKKRFPTADAALFTAFLSMMADQFIVRHVGEIAVSGAIEVEIERTRNFINRASSSFRR